MIRKRKRTLVLALGMALNCLSIATAADGSLAAQFNGAKFSGMHHSEGNTFEIVAKGKPVTVKRFDINIDAGTDTINVRSRPGVPGTVVEIGGPGMRIGDIDDDEDWILIQSFPNVAGQGKNNVTPLPPFDVPVVIPAGSKQAFYVTTTLGYQPVDIWYSSDSTSGLGDVYASNDDIDILEGYAVGSANGYVGWSGPRRWNGIVYYSVPDDESVADTADPTTSPIDDGTGRPLASSSSPSMSDPTLEPAESWVTSKPSLEPTTSDRQKPSSAPSELILSDPEKSPSSTPSSYPSLLPTAKFVSTNPTEERSPTSNSTRPSLADSSAPSSMRSPAPSRSVDDSAQILIPTGTLDSSGPSHSQIPSFSSVPFASNFTMKPTRTPFSSDARRMNKSVILFLLGILLVIAI